MTEEKVSTKACLVQGLSTITSIEWVSTQHNMLEPGSSDVALVFCGALFIYVVGYLTSLTGFIYAWPSYNIENFKSNETVLSHPMSSMEISLLGSLTNIGGLAATPLCGYAVNTFGRRYSAMLFGLPYVLAWFIISLTNYVPLVLTAVGLAGIGAAGQTVSSVFISEIAHDSIRGAMASSVVYEFFFGLLLSYILGGQLSYHNVVYAHLAMSILYVVLLFLLKESPVYLLQKGREKEAAKSIAFYRQLNVTSKEVEIEINKIKLQLDPRIDKILQESDSTATAELLDSKSKEPETKNQTWQFLKNSESSKRAVIKAILLMMFSVCMGSIILQVYAEPLFKEAVPSMQPNLCAILLALDMMIGSFFCAGIVDRFGRKFLMTITATGSGVGLVLLGLQLQFHIGPYWFTPVLIYLYCFVYNLGAATVPFIFASEIFLPEVRGLCNSLTMSSMWISNFVVLAIFNPIVEITGLGPVFYGFAIICFGTAAFSHFYLPETKGLSADAIQRLFLKKRRTVKC